MTREERILANRGLVIYVAGRYDYFSFDKEELIAVGNIGLVKAADSFEESRNVKFSTYAIKCIENEIISFLRKREEQMENLLYPGENLEIVDPKAEKYNEIMELKEAVSRLSKSEQWLIAVRYGIGPHACENMTQEKAAIYFGITQSALSRREQKVIEKLRKILQE